ncbi:NAD(P)-binding domain-containing protein [Celeribacter marinus]
MIWVGFAGLGQMGEHKARNLSRTGHEVALWPQSLTAF